MKLAAARLFAWPNKNIFMHYIIIYWSWLIITFIVFIAGVIEGRNWRRSENFMKQLGYYYGLIAVALIVSYLGYMLVYYNQEGIAWKQAPLITIFSLLASSLPYVYIFILFLSLLVSTLIASWRTS
ncbi:hypothetical protein SGRA_3777 [Saprospira grandis str. Lewin]|uniref:Uncharacterized protein n=1 Tax=Saprospira grandis (strain Lewin) TaxID=984262 RepID=H6L8C9_SAPGL|nr:hypothetical protein SGRA_3777 [Saprospira grandis str. Lewin]